MNEKNGLNVRRQVSGETRPEIGSGWIPSPFLILVYVHRVLKL